MSTVVSGPFPAAVERFPRLRQSLLSTFDSCALSAKFDFEYRSGWSSHPAARGTLVHRVFAKCLQEMVAQNESRVPVDVALAVLDETIRQHDVGMQEDGMNDVVVTVPLREIAEARIMVKTWAANSVWDPSKIASVEKRLSTMLVYPDDNGQPVYREFTGKLDMLLIEEDTAIVVDWKSSWSLPSEKLETPDVPSGDNVSDEGYFQMRAYALLVLRTYPRIQRVVLQEVYPRYRSGKSVDRKGRPINPVRQATIYRAELQDIEVEMNALVERFDRSYQADVWTPSPGSHCSYCPRVSACTILPEARAEGRIESQEDAEDLAARLMVAKSRVKQITDALRPWSEEHGDVPVKSAKGRKVYGPVIRTRKKTWKPEQIDAHVARGGRVEDMPTEEEYRTFTVHSPEEQHPTAAAIAQEEQILLAMEKELAARKGADS